MFTESLQEIADIIGPGAALSLANEFGGTEEYIPIKVKPHHKITLCIGPEAMQKLSEWAGGGRLDIPRAVAVHRDRRNTKIIEAAQAGQSKKSLALEHNLTTRWIRKITNEGEEETEQGNLF